MINFIKNIFTSGTAESSKRVFGGIGFICAIIFIALWQRQLTDTLLFVSSALLGLETIFNKLTFFNKSK